MTENKPIERKLLYETTEFSVGEDGMLCNPHNVPLRNIIYEIASEFSRKTQECEKLKRYLNQIRDEELSHLDIEWDEYEASARQEDYSNIITLVERALGEIDD